MAVELSCLGLSEFRRHAQQGSRCLVKNLPRHPDCLLESVLALGDFLRQDLRHLSAYNQGFGVGPFDSVGIGEKADLFVDRQHIKAFSHDVADGCREEVVPPITGQAEVGQFAAHSAQGLIGVAAGHKTLEMELRVPAYNFRQLGQGFCETRLAVSKGSGSAPRLNWNTIWSDRFSKAARNAS